MQIISVFSAVLIAFVSLNVFLRLRAAVFADKPAPSEGSMTKFGLGFSGNRFVFSQIDGWKRVEGIDRFNGRPITGPSRDARIRMEAAYRKERRKILFVLTLVIALQLFIIKLIIMPLPLAILLHVWNYQNLWEIYNNCLLNMTVLGAYLLGASGIYVWIIVVFLLGAAFAVPFFTLLHIGTNIARHRTILIDEVLYNLGVQSIDGAKVFDPPVELISHTSQSEFHTFTDDDPENPFGKSGSNSGSSSAGNGHENDFQQDDGGDPFGNARRNKSSASGARKKPRDPGKNAQDAMWFFGLTEGFSKADLDSAYKNIIKKYHEATLTDLPEHLREDAAEIIKKANPARDLLEEYRGW